MIMKKTFSVTLMLCGLFSVVITQHKMSYRTQTQVRLTKDKPTVYITFERAGKREPLEVEESSEGIWLRLHNNTHWTIFFPAFGVPKALGEVGMFYEIEATKSLEVYRDAPEIRESHKQENCTPELPVGYRLGHVYSMVRLPPGNSIVFSVPREHLAKGLALRISFNYEWQNEDDVFAGREPKSHVYFYSSKLPQIVR